MSAACLLDETSQKATAPACWRREWLALGASAVPVQAYRELMTSYGQKHRAYHTQQHLEECLELLDEVRAHCCRPSEVAMALWYHDAVYRPRSSDNEAASAAWLGEVAAAAGVAGESVARMQAFIMATRHAATPDDEDARILVDIDLAILGAAPERFDAYQAQIRREYRWVPSLLYRSKRAEVLRGFLQRSAIYSTGWFNRRYESAARRNLERALMALEGSVPG